MRREEEKMDSEEMRVATRESRYRRDDEVTMMKLQNTNEDGMLEKKQLTDRTEEMSNTRDVDEMEGHERREEEDISTREEKVNPIKIDKTEGKVSEEAY